MSRQKSLIKLLKRLIKQDYLYTDEKLREMKQTLRLAEEEMAEIEAKSVKRIQMNVELISITPDAEKTMAHIARVSNPSNQDNPNYAGLLRYCIKHNHWSVFEQSSMTLEIETTRAIASTNIKTS